MNRSFPLLVLLLALPASAGDTTQGKQAFTAACSRCHVARPAAKDAAGAQATDNLAVWLGAHSGGELRTWVKNPWAVNPKTRCDPRQLQPKDVDNLLSFLRSAKAPAPSAAVP